MPTLETTDKIAPRSALRYRPLTNDTATTEQHPIATSVTAPLVKRASRTRLPDIGNEVDEWKHTDSTNTRDSSTSTAPLPERTTTISRQSPKKPSLDKTTTQKKRRMHPFLYLGVGMLAMLAVLAVLSVVTNWLTITLDDLHYGRPRTFQVDALVGHNESTGVPSHFIALNLHSHIEIIELPGGDATHARIYLGPQLYGADADLVPVTLSFADVNGDHRPDMIIHFQGTKIVFINDQGGFRPLRPEERHQVDQFLQHLGP